VWSLGGGWVRDLRVLNGYRDRSPEVIEYYGSVGDATCGVFHIVSPITGRWMHVIAASGQGWDHVSVSMKERPPIWAEMEHVKRLFFKEDEVAMQLHVPPAEHVNAHPHTLHLWRSQTQEIPRPPAELIA
jgi:hypothetical protein